MFDKVAIVGDPNIVFGFRALGLKVFFPSDMEEAKKILEILEKEEYAFCFFHQSLLEQLGKEMEALRKKTCPVVLQFSDYRDVTDYLENSIKKMAVKATGSDSLTQRREKDERR